MLARILGTGSCLPEFRLTNDDLAHLVETSDEWIRERTGIRERRLTAVGTTAMAAEAAGKALADAGVAAGELDMILVATATPDYLFPGTACQVQAELGAAQAVCYDLSAACSGFLFALHAASAYIAAGMARTILVIGAETMSKITDWSDRGTCILFGDGAGAAVVRADETGILAADLGSDGSRGMVLPCRGRPLNSPAFREEGPGETIVMDGQEVFRFAVRTVPGTIRRALARADLAPEDIRYFLLHQANERILTSAAKKLGVPMERVPVNIGYCGNTAAASLPILLDEMNRAGKLARGDKIVLAGFGGGLTWGAVVLEW